MLSLAFPSEMNKIVPLNDCLSFSQATVCAWSRSTPIDAAHQHAMGCVSLRLVAMETPLRRDFKIKEILGNGNAGKKAEGGAKEIAGDEES